MSRPAHPQTPCDQALRAAEVIAVGATLARRGLIRGSEGNISVRLGADSVLITPRNADKGRLTATTLVRCALGAPPPPEASSEAIAHLEAYRQVADAGALVHAHPAALLALESLGRTPAPEGLQEGEALVRKIERVPVLPPGSRALAHAVAQALQRAPIALLSRHGVFARGATLWEALARVEAVELLAQVALARAVRS